MGRQPSLVFVIPNVVVFNLQLQAFILMIGCYLPALVTASSRGAGARSELLPTRKMKTLPCTGTTLFVDAKRIVTHVCVTVQYQLSKALCAARVNT